MGKIVSANQPCTSCASSDAVCIYEDGTSFCFSCRKWKPSAKSVLAGVKEFSPEPEDDARYSRKELTSFANIEKAVAGPLLKRKISKQVVEFFGIKISYNEDRIDMKHAYPYCVDKYGIAHAYKIREVLDKKFSSVGKIHGLFGQHLFPAGGKRLVITEGEIDTLSVAQASLDHYKKIYPVVSLRSATTVKNDLLENLTWIRSFDEVVLCMDNDEAGKRALDEACKIIGLDRVKIASFGALKDPNELLVKEGFKALINSIWDAQKFIPAGIMDKDKLWEALKNYNELESLPYPACMNGLNEKLKGLRLGEIDLFISGTGCLARGTKLFKGDGSLVSVEDIRVGDIVKGDSGDNRTVLELRRGKQQSYEIRPIKGIRGFICNSDHILTHSHNGTVFDTSIKELLTKGKTYLSCINIIRNRVPMEFSSKVELRIPPYLLGAWLGDGSKNQARIKCTGSKEVILDEISRLGWLEWKSDKGYYSKLVNRFTTEAKSYNLWGNKHIPEDYQVATVSERFELLAGLLDTDGHLKAQSGTFEFVQKDEVMTDQVVRLATSLGLTTFKRLNSANNCFCVTINGDHLTKIPNRMVNKKAAHIERYNNTYASRVDIYDVGEQDYFGFVIDGNHRFILEDGIITHNSGKSTVFRELMLNIRETAKNEKIGVISLEEAPAETARRLAGMKLKLNSAETDIPIEQLKIGFDSVFGDDKILLLDHQGSVNDDSLLDMIEYMALMNCRYIFLDHITLAVSEGVNDLTGNEAIDSLMSSLLKLVKRHNFWLGIISHLRKAPSSGKSFEEGLMPNLDSAKGSGSIKQISFGVVGFARDQVNPDPIVRSTINFSVLKNRYTGLTGPVAPAFYNAATGRLQPAEPSAEFKVLIPYDADLEDAEELAIEQVATFLAMYEGYNLE